MFVFNHVGVYACCVKRGMVAEPVVCPVPVSVPVTAGERLDADRDSAASADEQQQLINR